MHAVTPCSLCIGTLVVVYNRSVIEIQSHMCPVVAEDITPEGLARRIVVGQKQCHPAAQHCLILFESASCKNSDTSCLESKRSIDGLKFTRNTVDTS